MKATAIAPANIAFIKYWGKKDEKLRLPLNSSISMNLDNCLTTTTVEFAPKYKQSFFLNKKDIIEMIGEEISKKEKERIIEHLNRIRKLANSPNFARVKTKNSFPKSAGIAASASGFAALTLAASSAAGLKLSECELSILARLGSGSACRSIPDGLVEWKKGRTSEESFAYSLYSPDFWDIRDIILVVSGGKKKIGSTAGMENVWSSPFFEARLKNIEDKIEKLKRAMQKKDFSNFGEIIEGEAINMQAVMMTQKPPIFYWQPKTLEIMEAVWQWRKAGLLVYFTIDAGPNIHLICQGKDEEKVLGNLKELEGVKQIIVNKPVAGARLVQEHLF